MDATLIITVVIVVIVFSGLFWFVNFKLPKLHPFFRNIGIGGLIYQWKNPPSKFKNAQTPVAPRHQEPPFGSSSNTNDLMR